MTFLKMLLLLLPFSAIAQAVNEWKVFNKQEYAVEYPSDWSLSEKGEMGTSFILFSELESDQDIFRENINLIIQDLTGYNLDLDKYSKLSVAQVKKIITNAVLIESNKKEDSSSMYQKVVYTGDQGEFHLKFEQYYWVLNNKAYVLTFTAEVDRFEQYKETGEKILNSFVIHK